MGAPGMHLATWSKMTSKFKRRSTRFDGATWTSGALCVALSMAACKSEQVPLKQPVGVSGPRLAPSPGEDDEASSPVDSTAPRAQSEPDVRNSSTPRRSSSCPLPAEPVSAILFSTDGRALRPRGEELVEDLAMCMLRGPLWDETVVVRGYTDPRGSEDYNVALATERARTVKRQLVRYGVHPDRVRLWPVGERRARGYGPESWQLDRRVEISVYREDEEAPQTAEFKQDREDMIETLEREGISDPRVLEALHTVPRHELVPERLRPVAYENRPLPIGEGQTISQPYIVGLMTQLAHIDETDRVLEIGTGSGYQAAVLSLLAEEVYTIEIVEALGRRAQHDLKRIGLSDNVHFRLGDGFSGWPEMAPFDAILVTAAPEVVPAPLVAQLREGGRMIIPVGDREQELRILEKKDGELTERDVIPVRFVPMTGKAREQSAGP